MLCNQPNLQITDSYYNSLPYFSACIHPASLVKFGRELKVSSRLRFRDRSLIVGGTSLREKRPYLSQLVNDSFSFSKIDLVT